MQMETHDIVSFGVAFVAMIGTIGGVVIANRLTYARSNKEKTWDLRRQAYGVMLSELAAVKRMCDNADEYIDMRGFEEYFASKSRERSEAEIGERMQIVRARYSDDYLIFSKEFVEAFEKLSSDMASDPYNTLPPDEHDKFCKGLRENRPILLAIARKEINVETERSRPVTWFR